MSEVRESHAVRVALPGESDAPVRSPKSAPSRRGPEEPSRSGASTWLMVTVVALLCGGVLALALGADRPTHTTAAVEAATEVPLDPPPPATPTGGGPVTLAAASEAVSIEMYSATWCSACASARRWLGERGITYHEIDVDTRADAMGQLAALNPRRTLPTFDIDGDVVVGFDSGRLTSTIETAARRHR